MHAEAAMKELKNSPSISSVNMDQYDALYISGKSQYSRNGFIASHAQ